jgi:hypothetical protein
MVMEVSAMQPVKACSPIVVTLEGMSMEVRLLHESKALSPIVVTLSGMVMEVRLLHSEKALSPIVVTPGGRAQFRQFCGLMMFRLRLLIAVLIISSSHAARITNRWL